MKRALLVLAFVVAACVEDTDPPWQLDHDRVVAVRVVPPRILPGETARFEALVAHAGAPTSVEQPLGATAASAPGDLFAAVHFNIDHWEVNGPDEARLAEARAALGLAAGAPVPLEVTLQLPGPLYATKLVWLGDTHANPSPNIGHGPELDVGARYTLGVSVPPGGSARWLTSCGRLEGHDQERADHIVDAPCEGELVLVVRDGLGGVAWQVLPIRAD